MSAGTSRSQRHQTASLLSSSRSTNANGASCEGKLRRAPLSADAGMAHCPFRIALRDGRNRDWRTWVGNDMCAYRNLRKTVEWNAQNPKIKTSATCDVFARIILTSTRLDLFEGLGTNSLSVDADRLLLTTGTGVQRRSAVTCTQPARCLSSPMRTSPACSTSKRPWCNFAAPISTSRIPSSMASANGWRERERNRDRGAPVCGRSRLIPLQRRRRARGHGSTQAR